MDAAAELGVTLRRRRIELGMSQQHLATTLGVSRAVISSLENGHLGQARMLLEVAEALGLDLFAIPRNDPLSGALRQRLEQSEVHRTSRVRRRSTTAP